MISDDKKLSKPDRIVVFTLSLVFVAGVSAIFLAVIWRIVKAILS